MPLQSMRHGISVAESFVRKKSVVNAAVSNNQNTGKFPNDKLSIANE